MGRLTDTTKKKISDSLSLPTNAILGEPLVEITGMNRVRVENHKGIVKYTDNLIKINTTLATLLVIGKDLSIKTLIPEEIVVTGNVEKVEYQK